MKKPRIFISMGTPYNERYLVFRDELETFLRDQQNCDPRIIGKNDHPIGSPLNKIREVMSSCDGVVVVAYERKFTIEGLEKRGSKEEKSISHSAYTTPWNHIESAMAYTLQIPLYIICQNGLVEEGLIEHKIDWYVQYLDLKKGELSQPAVASSLKSWVDEKVRTRSRRSTPNLVLTGGIKLSEMTVSEIATVFGSLGSSFALGLAATSAFQSISKFLQ